MKISELFVYLGVKADEKKAKDFFRILEDGKRSFLGIAAAAVGTSIGVGTMFNKILGTSIALAQFNAQTGLSTYKLQEWQHAGEGLGASAEGVASSIASLSARLAEIRMTGAGIGPFARLGIDVMTKDVWQVLDEMRRLSKSGEISPQMFSNLAQSMGIMGDLIPVLRLSNDEFDRMANREAIISDDQIRQMVKFNVELKALGRTITIVFADAFKEVTPQLEDIVKKIDTWIKSNRPEIQKYAKMVGSYLGEIGNIGKATWEGLDHEITQTMGWANALDFLVAGLIAFKAPWLFFLDAINAMSIMQGPGSFAEKTKGIMTKTITGRMLSALMDTQNKSFRGMDEIMEKHGLGFMGSMEDLWGFITGQSHQKTMKMLFPDYYPDIIPESQKPPVGQPRSSTNNFNISLHSNSSDNMELSKMITGEISRMLDSASMQTQGAMA